VGGPLENTVSVCQRHPCCYEISLRYGQWDSAGDWDAAWDDDARKWTLTHRESDRKIERPAPGKEHPVSELIEAIPGTALNDIVDQILNKVGFPPPGCYSGAGN
jgi:hypothetical protein